MPLYERLLGLALPKLPVHQFMAMVSERVRNFVTTQQVTSGFLLSPDEVTEATTLTQRVMSAALTKDEVHDVLLLAEQLIPPYVTVAAVKTRLGV